eukprot:gene25211-biopygen10476
MEDELWCLCHIRNIGDLRTMGMGWRVWGDVERLKSDWADAGVPYAECSRIPPNVPTICRRAGFIPSRPAPS